MIRDWLSVFPREQFLFIRSEDFVKNPEDVIHDLILPFLNVSSHNVNKSIFSTVATNPKKAKRVDVPMLNTTRELLYELYRKPTQMLSELLNDKIYLWSDVTDAYL